MCEIIINERSIGLGTKLWI